MDDDYRPRKLAESMSKFTSLETLEISSNYLNRNAVKDGRVEKWLGDMNNIGAWQNYVRTLKRVVTYSVVVE